MPSNGLVMIAPTWLRLAALRVAGTLSVLDEAEQAGFVNFDDAVAELQKTSSRISQAVLSEIKAKRSR